MFVYFLQAENGYVDFSDVIVGSSACKQITLFNNSACSLHYRLSVDQTLDGPYPEEITRSDSFGKYWMLWQVYWCIELMKALVGICGVGK